MTVDVDKIEATFRSMKEARSAEGRPMPWVDAVLELCVEHRAALAAVVTDSPREEIALVQIGWIENVQLPAIATFYQLDEKDIAPDDVRPVFVAREGVVPEPPPRTNGERIEKAARVAWKTKPEEDDAPADTDWDTYKDCWLDGFWTGWVWAVEPVPTRDDWKAAREAWHDGTANTHDGRVVSPTPPEDDGCPICDGGSGSACDWHFA